MLSYFHFFGLQLMLLLNIFGSHLLPSFALYFNDGGGRFRDDDHRGRDQRPQLLLAQVVWRLY
jgi:hypothetical protein